MKKYRFPLRSVQTVRGIREMNAKEAFSAAVHAVALAEAELAGVRDALTNLEEAMRRGRSSQIRASEQVAYLQEHEFQRANEKRALAKLQKAKDELEHCREQWIKARRDVRVIENLENKFRQDYLREFEKEAQAQLDDRTSALSGKTPSLLLS